MFTANHSGPHRGNPDKPSLRIPDQASSHRAISNGSMFFAYNSGRIGERPLGVQCMSGTVISRTYPTTLTTSCYPQEVVSRRVYSH